MFTRFKSSVSVTLIVIKLGGCDRSEAVSNDFVAESNRLQRITMPAGAWLRERGRAKKDSLSVTQEWQVSTKASWTQYSEAVSRALEPAYRCSSESRPTTLCSRSLPGDYLQLKLVPERCASGLVVRVRLEVRPD